MYSVKNWWLPEKDNGYLHAHANSRLCSNRTARPHLTHGLANTFAANTQRNADYIVCVYMFLLYSAILSRRPAFFCGKSRASSVKLTSYNVNCNARKIYAEEKLLYISFHWILKRSLQLSSLVKWCSAEILNMATCIPKVADGLEFYLGYGRS
jgi:hypothetical protein